jgi:hypothetical protein
MTRKMHQNALKCRHGYRVKMHRHVCKHVWLANIIEFMYDHVSIAQNSLTPSLTLRRNKLERLQVSIFLGQHDI